MITLVVTVTELSADEIVVRGHRYRHLFRARRLAEGAVIRLVDGEGAARFGRAVAVEATTARIVPEGAAPAQEPSRYVELLAAVPKASRLSWMVEKATEVGVSAIRLIRTERAPRTIGVGTLARLRRVAVAAVEQCHRSLVPVISGVHSFADLPDLMESVPERWFLQPGSAWTPESVSRQRALILVGPEGGWTEGEIEHLSNLGCQPRTLGPTVLRIETAAVVGCAGLLIPGGLD